ncbi:HPr family phosphocarrier protein [Enterovibrio sp. ZSDZ42]|uniref:HPr family phosphocarrier protein n=1 Tax=Enterovibrio gelatinilyticus TaxID=2899819 RepID=A0ABT5QVJ7_9GAMM|nr:HPr family phosphocarrier protein [Enterovibrio sp. ZSDZ42]MDD1792036.1 HPr family phosphocarrier protein [Enterovibrio sp. ZSDZ42]
MTQVSKEVLIRNRLGLHARAAVKLVEMAQSYDAEVMISKDDQTVTADSVMAILLLDSSQGEQILISAEGQQAQQALDAVTGLIEAGFDEEN